MPSIIDSLVVTFGLDPKGYLAGQKKVREGERQLREEAKKTGGEFETHGKRAAEGFSKLRNEVVALLAIFTAGVGLKQFIEQTIEADAATGRLAHNLGVQTEALSAWQGVLKRNGGAAADADQGLQTLVDGLQQINLTGTSPLIPYLQLLKISLSDLQDPSNTLLKIADAFHNMDPRQASALGKSMGFSPAMVSVLEKGRAAVSAMLSEQQKLGVISQADAEAAQRLQNTLNGLKQAASAVGRTMLTIAAPALEAVAGLLTRFAEWAQKNQPIVIGAFVALGAAAIALGIAMLAPAAPFILLALAIAGIGAVIGGVIEAAISLGRWFMNLVRGNKQLSDAMDAVGDAASGLWSAVKDLFAPLAPIFDTIVGALKAVGSAISDAFGGASMAVARTFVGFLTNEFHALADIIRAITALLHGDLKGAMSAAKDWSKDIIRDQSGAPAAKAPAGAPATPGDAKTPAAPAGSATQAATQMIAGFEGFLGKAKWDRNAFRAGFGSDTTTDPTTGKVTKVTPGTNVIPDSAAADLKRRITSEFMPKVAAAVGGAWGKFSDSTKAALTSIAYNYGKLPRNVLTAARSGDAQAIAAAIKARAGDNDGINAKRRYAEAAAVGGATAAANANVPGKGPAAGLAVGARAQFAKASNDNPASPASGASSSQTDVSIGYITINTAATDAKGIADSIGPAVRQRSFVTQANTGLG